MGCQLFSAARGAMNCILDFLMTQKGGRRSINCELPEKASGLEASDAGHYREAADDGDSQTCPPKPVQLLWQA